MVLQYFYVEAMTNFSVIAEGFFSNPFVAVNNIVMCFCSLTFLQCCVNMVLDNVYPPSDSLARQFLLKCENQEDEEDPVDTPKLTAVGAVFEVRKQLSAHKAVGGKNEDFRLNRATLDRHTTERTSSDFNEDEFDDLRPDGELSLNELWAILTVEAIYSSDALIHEVFNVNSKKAKLGQ